MCQRYGQMPSDRWRLAEHGVPETVAYDFDLAVGTLAATMDARLQETEQVEVPNGPKPADGHHFEQHRKYTLRELIFERTGEVEDGHDDTDVFAGLPAALLLGE